MSSGLDPWRRVTLPAVFVLALCSSGVFTSSGFVPDIIQRHACFGTAFQVTCGPAEKIVVETARFGRNDTLVAQLCGTPYQRNCDVDVHFTLNRACAGKRKCSLDVGTDLFSDPCGYEEFLRVSYRCVLSEMIRQSCGDRSAPAFYGSGYIASPNYPRKYYMNADCVWKLSVQKRQTIKLTIIDFELDVKKGGRCNDFMEIITGGGAKYFHDCGSLGKELIRIASDSAVIRFRTGMSSLTQRGFLVHFKAAGPGCEDLTDLGQDAVVNYYMQQDELYANVSCREGLYFVGTHMSAAHLHCSNDQWDINLGACAEMLPVVVVHPGATSPESTDDHSNSAKPGNTSTLGVVLGFICAILLVLLLFVVTIYLHRSCKERYRRRHMQGKYDQWQVVNNLQYENEANDKHIYRFLNDCSAPDGRSRRQQRTMNKNRCNNDGGPTGGGAPDYNLMCSSPYDDDDSCDDKLDNDDDDDMCLVCGGHVRQRGVGRDCVCRPIYTRSTPGTWVDPGRRSRSRRDLRHCRARSGQWIRTGMAPTPSCPRLTPDRRRFSNSAPDLLCLDTFSLETDIDDCCCSPPGGADCRRPNNDSGNVFAVDTRATPSHGSIRRAAKPKTARNLFT